LTAGGRPSRRTPTPKPLAPWTRLRRRRSEELREKIVAMNSCSRREVDDDDENRCSVVWRTWEGRPCFIGPGPVHVAGPTWPRRLVIESRHWRWKDGCTLVRIVSLIRPLLITILVCLFLLVCNMALHLFLLLTTNLLDASVIWYLAFDYITPIICRCLSALCTGVLLA
jgi:hypothetical protein